MEQIIPLNIVTTYPVRWRRYEVLRDFVQNFYDAVGYKNWKEKFQYEYRDGILELSIDEITFNYEWLLHIGASTKTSNSLKYAGYFGEGFKIASLCGKRDFNWDITMQSDNWVLSVIFVNQHIDQQPVEILAYRLNKIPANSYSILKLSGISNDDYILFLKVLDSFYYPENKLMGKNLWADEFGAVYLRSNVPISDELPCVSDYGRRGAVFCGYQMLGTHPFDLVICLHKYEKLDRERRTLYAFEVIKVLSSTAHYMDSESAMIMLEKMRRYWNSIPDRKHQLFHWANVVNVLIHNIKKSPEVTQKFRKKYPNLLYREPTPSVTSKNRRSQARSWLSLQPDKYILVSNAFRHLGYASLEDTCEKYGGFVDTQKILHPIEEQCYDILESTCQNIFKDFFVLYNGFPKRCIIRNHRAIYHGMAVTYKNKYHTSNNIGMIVRYHIEEIYLKESIFHKNGFFDGLSTYIHELCHMFGSDSSSSFSLGLTRAMELLIENHEEVMKSQLLWKSLFVSS